ncbi:substrate of the Dot/Icm secretion system [Legionella adelaidensis]|uniref:Substrate of the Dot/Icm secretion system n=1 Tax=Legionella adelaidensis TaxID=45056 RepID=A0A0W0R3X1_9GAMM|nr:hypothetical protein [Legionella adelaidensis]KTC65764.1 substrate of the Dot/Icm secretion system [Legionella adelaidensis]
MKFEDKTNIEQLIALQKKNEKRSLEKKEEEELQALLEKYAQYKKLNSTQMLKQYQEDMKPRAFKVDGEDVDLQLMLQDYKSAFGKDKDFKEPKIANHELILEFSSPKEAKEFFLDQASKNRSFVVYDVGTNQIIAYAKDGQLYHGNGALFKPGDSLSPTNSKDAELDREAPRPQKSLS